MSPPASRGQKLAPECRVARQFNTSNDVSLYSVGARFFRVLINDALRSGGDIRPAYPRLDRDKHLACHLIGVKWRILPGDNDALIEARIDSSEATTTDTRLADDDGAPRKSAGAFERSGERDKSPGVMRRPASARSVKKSPAFGRSASAFLTPI